MMCVLKHKYFHQIIFMTATSLPSLIKYRRVTGPDLRWSTVLPFPLVQIKTKSTNGRTLTIVKRPLLSQYARKKQVCAEFSHLNVSNKTFFSAPGHGNFRLFSSQNIKTETESSKRDEVLEKSLEIDVSIQAGFLLMESFTKQLTRSLVAPDPSK